MSADKLELPTVNPWEVGLFLPTLAIFLWAIVERHEIFEDAVRDYSNGSSFILLLWTVPAFFILLGSRPWKARSKLGPFLTMFGLVVCSLSFNLIFSGHYGPYRSSVLQWELQGLPLGCALGSEAPTRSLSRHILNRDTGRRLLENSALLESVAKDFGRKFLAEDPQVAALVWEALKSHGLTFDDLWKQNDEYKMFFLACWQAQAESVTFEPDYSFRWAEPFMKEPGTPPVVLEASQVDTVIDHFYEKRSTLSAPELQSFLQTALKEHQRFPQSRLDELLQLWAQGLDGTQFPMLAKNLEQREKLKLILGERENLKLAVRVGNLDQSSYNVMYGEVPETLDLMIAAWFRSCGVSVEWTPWEQAEMQLQLHKKEKEGRTNYSDPFAFEMTLLDNGTESLAWPKNSFYWGDYDYDNRARVWPFGFDEGLLERKLRYRWY